MPLVPRCFHFCHQTTFPLSKIGLRFPCFDRFTKMGSILIAAYYGIGLWPFTASFVAVHIPLSSYPTPWRKQSPLALRDRNYNG